MKTYRGTLLLLAVLVVLGAFVYFYEVRGAEGTKDQQQEAQIFSLTENDVRTIDVRADGKETTLARDDAGKWQLTAPEKAEADDLQVSSVLFRVAKLNADKIVADKIDDPAQYGLDKPQLELHLGLADGKQEALYVGNENPLGTGSYARKDGADQLYLLNASIVSDLRNVANEPPKVQPTPTPGPTSTPTPGDMSVAPPALPQPGVPTPAPPTTAATPTTAAAAPTPTAPATPTVAPTATAKP